MPPHPRVLQVKNLKDIILQHLVDRLPFGESARCRQTGKKIADADRPFRFALLQATETCKSKSVACGGGKYDLTPSPRRG
jgi:hypothetical protein